MPGTATATVRAGTIGDRSLIARTLTEAFTAGDVAAWIVPEPDLRRAYNRGLLRPHRRARPAASAVATNL